MGNSRGPSHPGAGAQHSKSSALIPLQDSNLALSWLRSLLANVCAKDADPAGQLCCYMCAKLSAGTDTRTGVAVTFKRDVQPNTFMSAQIKVQVNTIATMLNWVRKSRDMPLSECSRCDVYKHTCPTETETAPARSGLPANCCKRHRGRTQP